MRIIALLLITFLFINSIRSYSAYLKQPEKAILKNGKTFYQYQQLESTSKIMGQQINHGSNNAVGFWGLILDFIIIIIIFFGQLTASHHLQNPTFIYLIDIAMLSLVGIILENIAEYLHMTNKLFTQIRVTNILHYGIIFTSLSFLGTISGIIASFL